MRLLQQHFPNHPTDDAFWRRLQSEASDDFRSEVNMPLYRRFVLAKIRFAIEGPTYDLDDEIQFLRRACREQACPDLNSKLPGDDDPYWRLMSDLIRFDKHIYAAREVPDLERRTIADLSEETGINLWSAGPKARSMAFLKYIDGPEDFPEEFGPNARENLEMRSDGSEEIWEGLPLALMRQILTRFAQRNRNTGFWQRIQQSIGFGFSVSSLEYPQYIELINLQIRAYGFQEPTAKLLPLIGSLRSRLNDSDKLDPLLRDDWQRSLDELERRLQSRHAGRDSAAGAGPGQER